MHEKIRTRSALQPEPHQPGKKICSTHANYAPETENSRRDLLQKYPVPRGQGSRCQNALLQLWICSLCHAASIGKKTSSRQSTASLKHIILCLTPSSYLHQTSHLSVLNVDLLSLIRGGGGVASPLRGNQNEAPWRSQAGRASDKSASRRGYLHEVNSFKVRDKTTHFSKSNRSDAARRINLL